VGGEEVVVVLGMLEAQLLCECRERERGRGGLGVVFSG